MVLYTEQEVLDALEEISDDLVYSQILHLYFKEVITDQQREEHFGEDNLHERNEEVMLEFEVDEVPGCQQVLDKASQRLYSHCMNFSMLDFGNCFYTCVCV